MKKLHYLTDEPRDIGNYGYIKCYRGEHVDVLQEKSPAAVLLLYQIARRARRADSEILGLSVGEALIGDYKRCGIKTEQIYRTAKEILQKLGFITTRATNKGTIAKLIDTSIFDINAEINNEQDNDQITDKQRPDNDQITTNKKDKKEKKERMKEGERPSIEDLRAFISEKGYNVNPEKWLAHYEANGWMVGRNKMKDWKAAVRTWHHGNFNDGGNGRSRSSLHVGAQRPEIDHEPQPDPVDTFMSHFPEDLAALRADFEAHFKTGTGGAELIEKMLDHFKGDREMEAKVNHFLQNLQPMQRTAEIERKYRCNYIVGKYNIPEIDEGGREVEDHAEIV